MKGFITASLAVIVAGALTSLEAGALPDLTQLKTLGLTGLAAGFAYLLKNLLTNSDGALLSGEKK